MSGLATLQLLLLAAVALFGAASLAVSLLTPSIVGWTQWWVPAARNRTLVCFGVAPLVLTAIAMLSALGPSLFAASGMAADHCLVHGGHHAHLCFLHLSSQSVGIFSWVVTSCAVCALLVPLLREGFVVGRAVRLLNALRRNASFDEAINARVVHSSRPFCFTAGLVRPCLLVSEGLLAAVSADDLRVVLAHEDGHRRRRDMGVRFLVRLSTIWLVPGSRRELLIAIELSSEQACDEIAAATLGDRLRVAETILTLERVLSRASFDAVAPAAASIGASSVPDRVESLVCDPRAVDRTSVFALGLSFATVSILIASEPLHHTLESVLASFLH